MANIAALAVKLCADAIAGKTPVEGNALAASAKGDFRQHLAVAQTTAKPVSQAPKNPPATADALAGKSLPAKLAALAAKPAATPDAAPALLPAAPQSGATAAVKTLKPGKKAPVNKAAVKENAGQARVQPQAAAAPALPAPASTPATAAPENAAPRSAAHPALPANPQAALQPGKPAPQATVTGKPETAPNSHAAPTLIAAAQTPPHGAANTAATGHAAATPDAKTVGVIRQLSNALAAAANPGGGRALHVALRPESLGGITVKIEHRGGGAQVTITASQPETLESLKKDTENLNQILTNAGVAEGRQIEFRAAPVAAAQAGGGLGDANPSMQGNSGGQQMQHGTGFANSAREEAAKASFDSVSPLAKASIRSGGRGNVDVIA